MLIFLCTMHMHINVHVHVQYILFPRLITFCWAVYGWREILVTGGVDSIFICVACTMYSK